jgi:hypothetical protein
MKWHKCRLYNTEKKTWLHVQQVIQNAQESNKKKGCIIIKYIYILFFRNSIQNHFNNKLKCWSVVVSFYCNQSMMMMMSNEILNQVLYCKKVVFLKCIINSLLTPELVHLVHILKSEMKIQSKMVWYLFLKKKSIWFSLRFSNTQLFIYKYYRTVLMQMYKNNWKCHR